MADYTNTVNNSVDKLGGGSAELKQFLGAIMQAESGGNPRARNPKSSAYGLFQQLDANWQQYGQGDRSNPANQSDAAVRFAVDNGKMIQRVTGHEPTAGEYYLAHFLGPGGAEKILKANPNTSLRAILPNIIGPNRGARLASGKEIANFTAGDLREWANEKMNANIPGAADYNRRHAAGQTTPEEDATEAERRRRQLGDYGYSEEGAKKLSMDDLLGQVFLQILINIFDSSKSVPAGKGIDDNRAVPSAASPAAAVPQADAAAGVGNGMRATTTAMGATISPALNVSGAESGQLPSQSTPPVTGGRGPATRSAAPTH